MMSGAGELSRAEPAPRSEEPSRRVLVTGVSTFWGGRLAQALEGEPGIEALVGVDPHEPSRELGRTEFVKVPADHRLLERIVRAARIDTVVDTRLVVDSIACSRREAHENNVIGTMNILAACTGSASPVRKFVFKSSAHYYGCGHDDPAFFSEAMRRPRPPASAIERDIVEAEAAVAEYAERHPAATVTLMRCANVLGPGVRTSHTRMFDLPVVPMMLGFDPRYQFVHEDDLVRALAHAVRGGRHGIFNVAADGVLALSEVIGLLGKLPVPLLPPWGAALATGPLRAVGLRIPDEMVRQLRYGRGLDNRLFRAGGFEYRYTTREAVLKLAAHQRLHPVLRGDEGAYTYDREVEEFVRRNPLVRDSSREHDPGDV